MAELGTINTRTDINTAVETNQAVPTLVSRVSSSGTRVAQTDLEGAVYRLDKATTFNRIVLRVTARTGTPTGKFLIYQRADGVAGTASRVATVEAFSIPAPGNFLVTPSEGAVTLKAGLIWLLWGRDSGSGSFTMQTYGITSISPLNDNVDSADIPLSFTTVIAASAASPASFDPTEGGDADAAAAINTALVARLRNV